MAGRHGLFFVKNEEVVDAGMWYQVQFARWEHETKKLIVVWVEPDREPVIRTTIDSEPTKFLRRLTFSVDKTIVASKSLTVPSGATISATARRRADGEVFTTVLVKGELAVGEESVANTLEAQLLRELNVT